MRKESIEQLLFRPAYCIMAKLFTIKVALKIYRIGGGEWGALGVKLHFLILRKRNKKLYIINEELAN